MKPLWQPSLDRQQNTKLFKYKDWIEKEHKVDLPDYAALHRWSVENPGKFWRSVWQFCNLKGDLGQEDGYRATPMFKDHFFPQGQLNFAENLLHKRDDGIAIISWTENGPAQELSFSDLYDKVSQCQQALKNLGVKEGDRVAGYLPNIPETIIAMLAATSLGAIWSSCSPDFGTQGVLDRFGQIQPKVIFTVDGYQYNGKNYLLEEKLTTILPQLSSLEAVVVIPFLGTKPSLPFESVYYWPYWLESFTPTDIDFPLFPFNHPLYILYSSGTTGAPKCIVHGAGGTLIQHTKEHQLQCDIHPGDRFFYFTTCGWMMWHWLVSGLASEAALVLYDGNPLYRDGRILFDLAQATRVTHFGTSAKFIDGLRKMGLNPRETHDLSALRVITSTGSPLIAEGFDYVYSHIKSDVHLASISGGTDIISCFVGGNPLGPVWAGEIQAPGLGMAVAVYNDQAQPMVEQKGELVCRQAFPSMPIYFWHDPEDRKYHKAYFEKYPGIWCHGDFIEQTNHGGYIIYGRSDATLNPGGVRIGTAEIYRQVEDLDEILESLVIGQHWQDDERVILFVRLKNGYNLDNALEQKIKTHIRNRTTPRHVPAKIIAVSDLPRTKNNKISELAVREIIHNRPITNREALANPECLEEFENREELQE